MRKKNVTRESHKKKCFNIKSLFVGLEASTHTHKGLMKFKFFTFHYFGKIFAKDQTKVCVFVHIVSKLTVIPWKIYSVKWIDHRRPIISQFRYRVLKSVIRWVYRMNKMILCASLLLLLDWNHIFWNIMQKLSSK